MQYLAVLFLLAGVSLVMSNSKGEAKLEASFKHHTNRVKKYPCRVPQPRVFRLEELVTEKKWKDNNYELLRKYIFPYETVLHRCNSSGCCRKPDEQCKAAVEEDVMLTFSIFSPKIGYRILFEIPAKNHTECNCGEGVVATIK